MNVISFVAAVLPFAVAMSFTPGPNNLMLATAGARFGFLLTLAHQCGIVVGFASMVLCVGFGVTAIIVKEPSVYLAMKIASLVYMLWLAWKTARARPAEDADSKGAPMSFLAAAAFQWVNPKAWMMILTAVAAYSTPNSDRATQVITLALVFATVGAASSSTWVLFGQLIRRVLTTPRKRIAFNWTMALLLLVSMIPVMFERP